MSHHDTTCFSGIGACRVGRAIVDDEGAIPSALDVGDDARNHRCLIVGSDDNPYCRLLRRHRSSRNEEKTTQKSCTMQSHRQFGSQALAQANAGARNEWARESWLKLRIQTHRTVSAA